MMLLKSSDIHFEFQKAVFVLRSHISGLNKPDEGSNAEIGRLKDFVMQHRTACKQCDEFLIKLLAPPKIQRNRAQAALFEILDLYALDYQKSREEVFEMIKKWRK